MGIRWLRAIVAALLCAGVLSTIGCGGDTTIIVIPGSNLPGQGTTAQDDNAKNLVRNAMTVILSAYVDIRTFDPAEMTPDVLHAIEPSITFNLAEGLEAAAASPTAQAPDNEVNYYGASDSYSVGARSQSGNTFGAVERLGPNKQSSFYVNGEVVGW